MYGSVDEVYEIKPTGMFSETQSILKDDDFDETDKNYV